MQSIELGSTPPIGAVVVIGDLLGAVVETTTGPIDQSRTTVALGLDGADVTADHPELSVLLRSTFTVRPLGTLQGEAPTSSAAFHASVRAATPDECAVLARDFSYLHRLSDTPIDVLVAHVLAVAPERATRVRAAGALVPALLHESTKLQLVLRALDATPYA